MTAALCLIACVFSFWLGVAYGGILRGDRRQSFRKAKELEVKA